MKYNFSFDGNFVTSDKFKVTRFSKKVILLLIVILACPDPEEMGDQPACQAKDKLLLGDSRQVTSGFYLNQKNNALKFVSFFVLL